MSTDLDINNVPVLDEDVKIELRKLGEPITYFGEGHAERRERLINHLQERPAYFSGDSSNEDLMDETDESEDEEFYTPGTDDLYNCRVKLLSYSLEKANKRIAYQRQLSNTQDFNETLKHRRYVNKKVGEFELYGTQVIPGNTRTISSVRFNKDASLIAAGSWDGNFYIINRNDLLLKCKLVSGFHSEKISGLDWNFKSNSDTLVTGGNEGNINVWNISESKDSKLKPCSSIKGAHLNRITKTLFHPSGDYIISTSFDQTWKLWDVARPEKELVEQEGHSKEVFAASFHPDGSLLSTGGLDAIGRIWDLRSGRSIATLEGHIKGIYSMDWSDNGYHLATASGDCSVKIWDLRKLSKSDKNQELFTIPAHNKLVSDVRFFHKRQDYSSLDILSKKDKNEDSCNIDSNGSFLITSSYDNTVNIWSADNWIKVRSLQGHNDKVMSCDISSNASHIASSGWDRSLKLWSI